MANTGLVTREYGSGHVVSGRRTVPERFGRKRSSILSTPWAPLAWVFTVPAESSFNRDNLCIRPSGTDSDYNASS